MSLTKQRRHALWRFHMVRSCPGDRSEVTMMRREDVEAFVIQQSRAQIQVDLFGKAMCPLSFVVGKVMAYDTGIEALMDELTTVP